jgi:hypothetical protein
MSVPSCSIENPFQNINPHQPYTAREAMRFLRISRNTLYMHLNNGDLASIKLGNKRMFLGRHILSFLELCEERAT